MEVSGWRYYNHAAVPDCAPHESPDLRPVETGDIWKIEKKPLLARWITDWDCGFETEWWYVIKDTPLNISEIKAKHRYQINQGMKNFNVELIDFNIYHDEILQVLNYVRRNCYSEKSDIVSLQVKENDLFFGAFSKETGKLCGYSTITQHEAYADFTGQKVLPEYEKLGANAAIVYKILQYYEDKLITGNYYLLNGTRTINHRTNFNDYLERIFEFRKAYCHLHIIYRKPMRFIVQIGMCFRKIFNKLDSNKYIHMFNGVLAMEEIVRMQGAK